MIFVTQAKCLSLLREQTIESLTPPDFEELSEATVMSIVKDEAMNISELKLFDTVVRWAGYQCAQRDLQMNGANMRQVQLVVYSNVFYFSKVSKILQMKI